jgi:hypothetical protein
VELAVAIDPFQVERRPLYRSQFSGRFQHHAVDSLEDLEPMAAILSHLRHEVQAIESSVLIEAFFDILQRNDLHPISRLQFRGSRFGLGHGSIRANQSIPSLDLSPDRDDPWHLAIDHIKVGRRGLSSERLGGRVRDVLSSAILEMTLRQGGHLMDLWLRADCIYGFS